MYPICFPLIKAWRSYNDRNQETLNGDATYSSLAAKGFRSVRPNLQEKKSPTQVILHILVYRVISKVLNHCFRASFLITCILIHILSLIYFCFCISIGCQTCIYNMRRQVLSSKLEGFFFLIQLIKVSQSLTMFRIYSNS